jgi:aminoglycoside phosphotransferase family enzyme/predicted kinase
VDSDSFRIDALVDVAAFPHSVTRLELKETHISWIVLTGPYAYKIKKPVRFPFLDASTLERRRWLCEEEFRLNRRFAPDLYVDVVPIASDDGKLVVGGTGQAVEFAVRMHEFDPSEELAARLDRRAVTPDDMRSIASQVAGSHRRAAVAPAAGPFGTFEKIQAPMLENFSLLRSLLHDTEELHQLERLANWCADSLARLEPGIRARLRSGMVRECHGDLHARNIVRWRQSWLPFDCIEFDPDLRWIDVISDAAFLYMDLMSRHRADLASAFLSRYLEETGDYAGLRLLPLYCAYFALVRAKVDALGMDTATASQRAALEARLVQRLAAAMRFMDEKPPALVIMHGVSGSGKSWLSEPLIPEIHALRIRSDLERSRPAGIVPPAAPVHGVGQGKYTATSVQRTYRRLAECADSALAGGCSIIVDATFLQRAHRELFRDLAHQHHCGFLIVSCAADTTTLETRIELRARDGLDPSEATRAVLDQQLRTCQPLSADEMRDTVSIDTSRIVSADAAVTAIRSRLGALGCLRG